MTTALATGQTRASVMVRAGGRFGTIEKGGLRNGLGSLVLFHELLPRKAGAPGGSSSSTSRARDAMRRNDDQFVVFRSKHNLKSFRDGGGRWNLRILSLRVCEQLLERYIYLKAIKRSEPRQPVIATRKAK